MRVKPIRASDTIHVRGKRLYNSNGTPFIVKGIAFPTPPESLGPQQHYGYDAESWLAILYQLRDLGLEFNTIRLYRLYSSVDYSEFFRGAAELGVYVIVPLTSAEGPGVLDRKLPAPKCYKSKLFVYGARAVREYLQYPNVLAGMVGNEVMNDEKAWLAAPCIRAYARDLKVFMDTMVEEGVADRTLPLIYAAQDSATIGGATVDKDAVMKLTVDYLSRADEGKGVAVADLTGEDSSEEFEAFSDNKFGQSPIDIYGVNIESWCSSTQDFYYNPDGTPGSYYSLWEALRNSSIPIIFSEMGCPHSQFDRDDAERKTKEGTRDWAQIPIVLDDMADSWSGFIAYTYDGPQDFTMFKGGPWDGKKTLQPTKDFENFKYELHHISDIKANISQDNDEIILPSQCNVIETELMSCCDVRLFSDSKMPSYATMVDARTGRVANNNYWFTLVAFLIALAATALIHKRSRPKKGVLEGISLFDGTTPTNGYKSIG